jgi:hypothetical protein
MRKKVRARRDHLRETSDCLLSIGYRPLEVTTGDFSASLPADTIHARGIQWTWAMTTTKR